jgi:hypothetical protein
MWGIEARCRMTKTEADTLTFHRFTVAQFQQLEATGMFRAEDRVELIEGLIVRRERLSPMNATCIGRLRDALAERFPAGWFVRIQMDVAFHDSQPVPDGSVACGDWDDYADHHPGAEDVGLVVEVAEATVEVDRTSKLRLYARERIPTYWIVNIPERQLEVYTRPREGEKPTYGRREVFVTGSVSYLLDGAAIGPIPVADLLPPT